MTRQMHLMIIMIVKILQKTIDECLKNDKYIDIDHTNRPIPAGLISADETLVYSRILLSAGLLIVLFGLHQLI